jgi:hypothetical protein
VRRVQWLTPGSLARLASVGFPAVRPPEKSAFQYYFTGKGKDAEGQDFADRPAVVQGQAATVDFRTAIAVDRREVGSTYAHIYQFYFLLLNSCL